MDTCTAAETDVPTVSISLDEDQWRALVERYQPLVASVCRRFRLRPEDAADVSQHLWLKLCEKIGTIRDMNALPGWIKSTTEHAAIAMYGYRRRHVPVPDTWTDEVCDWSALSFPADDDVDADLLRREQVTAVREGLAILPPRSRALLGLLVADPPVGYEAISRQLDMAVGSIGPTRARCLDKLAATAPVRAWLEVAA